MNKFEEKILSSYLTDICKTSLSEFNEGWVQAIKTVENFLRKMSEFKLTNMQGNWEFHPGTFFWWECSNCNQATHNPSTYCYNCGAKMLNHEAAKKEPHLQKFTISPHGVINHYKGEYFK